MKNELTLCVFLPDIYYLLNLEETMQIVPPPASQDIFNILDKNVLVNQSSLLKVKDFFYKYYGKEYYSNIERLYFGVETCENLIPKTEDVVKAYEFCQQKEYDFTFVTPYCGPKGIEKLIPIFEYLNQKEDIEIVVNDFGVLQMINEQFSNLIPSLGRLMAKLKRDPRFSKDEYAINQKFVNDFKKVKKNQERATQAISLEIPSYQEFLKQKGITRVGVDVVPQGIERKTSLFGGKSIWYFPTDIYWPWTYVTSGRNCRIAAVTQPGKNIHPTDEDCYFQCRLYEFTFTSDKEMFDTIQRGNAVWMNSESLADEYFTKDFSRLVYTPYIPV
jgi:hypothetical protein